jgi:hypothetical protein
MKIRIILEVDADDLDWGNSSVHPVDAETWGSLYDYDLDTVKYEGQAIDFVDTDKACEWLEFLYLESDQKDYAHA